MNERVLIQHWKYLDGSGGIKPGWRCWCYTRYNSPEFDIEGWMDKHMTGEYECDLRFNSGDPMYTIRIKENRDAEFFALNFIN